VRVKICGITRIDQGKTIAEMGASALGFICAPQSPRYLQPEQIGSIVQSLPASPKTGKPIDCVGVFVDAELAEIVQVVEIGRLTSVQLHGTESSEFCQMLRSALPDIEIIKALRIQAPASLMQIVPYETCVDTLLLDAYHPKMMGGTGITIDWTVLQNFRSRCPWLLAGGLTPTNVLTALSQLTPDGIDLSSGLEHAPGDKDLEKVAHLFQQLAEADRQQKTGNRR
jgi:phosphoribosylanthranilate isomerase